MKKLHDGTEVPLDTPTKSTSNGRFILTAEELLEREEEEVQNLLEIQTKKAEFEEEQAIQKIMRNEAKAIYDKMTKAEKDALKEI